VATFYLVPGYSKIQAFCAEAKLAKHDEFKLIVDSTIISDDKDDEEPAKKTGSDSTHWKSSNELVPCGFGIDDTPRKGKSSTQAQTDSHEHPTKKNPTTELLKYHQRMGHIPFAKLQLMAKQGVLPKHLAKCKVPVCSSCLYAKMSKKPWWQKLSSSIKKVRQLQPGKIISVDQMVLPTAGFIAQMTGMLTTKWYKYATIYVDQATCLGNVYHKPRISDEWRKINVFLSYWQPLFMHYCALFYTFPI
jgi:hypothetical protein